MLSLDIREYNIGHSFLSVSTRLKNYGFIRMKNTKHKHYKFVMGFFNIISVKKIFISMCVHEKSEIRMMKKYFDSII